LKRDIRHHFQAFLRINFADEEQWKRYSNFDEVSQTQTFNLGKLTTHFKYQYKFLVAMSYTQLFAEFLQNKKEPVMYAELKDRAGLFIADWLFFKWKLTTKAKSIVAL